MTSYTMYKPGDKVNLLRMTYRNRMTGHITTRFNMESDLRGVEILQLVCRDECVHSTNAESIWPGVFVANPDIKDAVRHNDRDMLWECRQTESGSRFSLMDESFISHKDEFGAINARRVFADYMDLGTLEQKYSYLADALYDENRFARVNQGQMSIDYFNRTGRNVGPFRKYNLEYSMRGRRKALRAVERAILKVLAEKNIPVPEKIPMVIHWASPNGDSPATIGIHMPLHHRGMGWVEEDRIYADLAQAIKAAGLLNEKSIEPETASMVFREMPVMITKVIDPDLEFPSLSYDVVLPNNHPLIRLYV